MIKKSITPKQVIMFLNSLLKIDSKAISEIFLQVTPCNKKLAKHPTVQVRKTSKFWQYPYLVRPIGILNGLFGTDKDGWGCLSMDIKRGKITKFRLIKENDKPKIKND